MAFRKNTAETFEILHRLATEAAGEAVARGRGAAEGAGTAGAGGGPEGHAAPLPEPARVRATKEAEATKARASVATEGPRDRGGSGDARTHRLVREPVLKPEASIVSRRLRGERLGAAPSVGRRIRCRSAELTRWLEDSGGPSPGDRAADAAWGAPGGAPDPRRTSPPEAPQEVEPDPREELESLRARSLLLEWDGAFPPREMCSLPPRSGAPPRGNQTTKLDALGQGPAPRRRGVDPVLELELQARDARRVQLLESREPPPAARFEPEPAPQRGAGGSGEGDPEAPGGSPAVASRGPGTGELGGRHRGAFEDEASPSSGGDAEPAGASRQAGPGVEPETVFSPLDPPQGTVSSPLEECAPSLLGREHPPQGTVPGGRREGRGARAARWLLGHEIGRALERRVEVRVATLLAASLVLITTVALVLTFLGLPAPEEPRFAGRGIAPEAEGLPAALETTDPGAGGPEPVEAAGAPGVPQAVGVFPPRSPQGDGVFPPRSPQRDEAAPGARRLPLWSPQFPRILPLTAGGGQGLAGLPEIRNVQGPAAPPGTPAGASSPAGGEPAEAAAPAAPPSPYHYRIQVRAKESWTGAQRILEYLETFGFQDGYLETDARGDTGSDGKPLYTVFVGHFFDERDAQEECDRLKRETRQRPYKSRGRFFEDSLVLRRQR